MMGIGLLYISDANFQDVGGTRNANPSNLMTQYKYTPEPQHG